MLRHLNAYIIRFHYQFSAKVLNMKCLRHYIRHRAFCGTNVYMQFSNMAARNTNLKIPCVFCVNVTCPDKIFYQGVWGCHGSGYNAEMW